jgi:hypothetical protein
MPQGPATSQAASRQVQQEESSPQGQVHLFSVPSGWFRSASSVSSLGLGFHHDNLRSLAGRIIYVFFPLERYGEK